MRSSEQLAATVVLLRAAGDDVEVLLLERPDRGSFAGAWVFPGGSVDAEDAAEDAAEGDDEDAALRRAAVRETLEETGLVLAPDELVPLSRWAPPVEAPKRFLTTFFLAEAPDGIPSLNPAEAVAYAWMTPSAALQRHGEGGMVLYPPTWVTLNALARGGAAASLLAAARAAGRSEYATRFGLNRTVVLWEGDVAYDDDARFDEPGGRHRLDMRTGQWVYIRSE